MAAQAPDGQAEARRAYSLGVEAYARGDNEQAREQFAVAEQKFPSPNIELMLGRTLARLGRNVEAHRILSRALRSAREAQRYASTATAARDELLEVEKRLAIVRLKVLSTHGDETLKVNGEELEQSTWTEPIAVEPGLVRIELLRADAALAAQQVELSAGSAVALSLKPSESAKTHATGGQLQAPAPATQASRPAAGRGTHLRGFAYALVGVGAVGLAGFGVLGALSNAQFATLEDACMDANSCSPMLQSHASRGQTYQTLANIALVAGAATLTTGVTLWLVSLGEDRASVALTGNAIQLRGSF